MPEPLLTAPDDLAWTNQHTLQVNLRSLITGELSHRGFRWPTLECNLLDYFAPLCFKNFIQEYGQEFANKKSSTPRRLESSTWAMNEEVLPRMLEWNVVATFGASTTLRWTFFFFFLDTLWNIQMKPKILKTKLEVEVECYLDFGGPKTSQVNISLKRYGGQYRRKLPRYKNIINSILHGNRCINKFK